MSKLAKFVSWFLFALFFAFGAAKAVFIPSPMTDIDSLEIKIEIDESGQVSVSEDFFLSAPSADFSWNLSGPIKNLQVYAESQKIEEGAYQISESAEEVTVTASRIEGETQNWSLSYLAPRALTSNEKDNLHLVLVLEPGVYLGSFKATVFLPKEIDLQDVGQRIYAVHGVEKSDFKVLPPNALIYNGEGLSPSSTYTIAAFWPRGIIEYSFFGRLSFFIASHEFIFWFIIGLILPLAALSFYLYMLFKRQKDKKKTPSAASDKPPEDLPPAVVGILFRERASSVEIASTILDLASRGFIDIVKKREEYVLGKRRGSGTLRPFEAYLYDKIFTQQGKIKIKRTEFELEKRASQQLFSPKVSHFFEALYREVRKRNYFIKNPQIAILKYRAVGVIFFLMAIFTSLLAIKLSGGAPYPLFGCLGQIIASFLIIKTASLMPKRTEEGRKALSDWLAFRNYLTDRELFGSSSSSDLFVKYLPHALVFGKEIEWASRFSKLSFTLPSWFVAEEKMTLEGFASNLFYITSSLSRLLHGLKEPGA